MKKWREEGFCRLFPLLPLAAMMMEREEGRKRKGEGETNDCVIWGREGRKVEKRLLVAKMDSVTYTPTKGIRQNNTDFFS